MSKESEIEHEYKLRLQEMKATIEQHSQHIVMLSTQLDKVYALLQPHIHQSPYHCVGVAQTSFSCMYYCAH